jgi:hypothetical protein
MIRAAAIPMISNKIELSFTEIEERLLDVDVVLVDEPESK